MKIQSWKAVSKGSLRGFAKVEIGELVISDIAILDGKNGLFASLPKKAFGNPPKYTPLVEFISRDRAQAFSDALVKALQQAHPEDFNENVSRFG